jgi:hypothetical protein
MFPVSYFYLNFTLDKEISSVCCSIFKLSLNAGGKRSVKREREGEGNSTVKIRVRASER